MPYSTTIVRKTPLMPIQGVASITPATLGPTTREKFGAIVFMAAALRVKLRPDHLHQQRLPGRHVERERDPLHQPERPQVPDLQHIEQAQDRQRDRPRRQGATA